MGLMSETCTNCKKEISMWKAISLNNKPYCKECADKEEKRRKEEAEKPEYIDGYCSNCKKLFKIQINDNIGTNAAGIGLFALTGVGFITSSKLNPCPYCGGKIKRGKLKDE